MVCVLHGDVQDERDRQDKARMQFERIYVNRGIPGEVQNGRKRKPYNNVSDTRRSD